MQGDQELEPEQGPAAFQAEEAEEVAVVVAKAEKEAVEKAPVEKAAVEKVPEALEQAEEHWVESERVAAPPRAGRVVLAGKALPVSRKA